MADGDMQSPDRAIRLFDHENCKRGTLCCTVIVAELQLPWLPTIFRLVGTVFIITFIIIIIIIFFSFFFL
jgi:hypothetical protein